MSDNDPTRDSPPERDGTASHEPTPTGTFGDHSGPRAQPTTGAVPGFEIEDTLGHGAFGVVYKARQVGLNRTVALKMLIAGPFAGAAVRARFLIEAEAVAALEHPHIVRVFQVGEHAEHPFLAMEFVPGGTLANRVKAGGPLPAADAARVVAKLAEAVAHAHSRGVVHRDIKPHNVLLTSDGEPRLTDFGLAKVGRSDMTVTGQILGTPAYMAPEQAAGKVHEVGTASDVYALGAVLYDVLTGRPPFLGDSHAVTLQKVLTDEPERLRRLNAAVPRDLETICLKCLTKEPGGRYVTAQALADDLARHLRGEPIAARPAGAIERRYKWVKRNKVVAGAGSAVLLALVVGAGVSIGFGLEARKQEKLALKRESEAKEAAEREEKEKRDAVAARNEVQRALAQALLAPIGTGEPDKPPTANETRALWELAARRGTPVGEAFLDEATRPAGARQLERRAEFALHAAIGLDATLRDATARTLLAELRSANGRAERRASLAVVYQRWDYAVPALDDAAVQTLRDAFVTGATAERAVNLAQVMTAISSRLVPEAAVAVLADAIAQAGDDAAVEELARGLSRATARLEPLAAIQAIEKAMRRANRRIALGELAIGAATAARRLDRASAAAACERMDRLLDVVALGQGLEAGAKSPVYLKLAKGQAALKAALSGAAAEVGDPPFKRLRMTVVYPPGYAPNPARIADGLPPERAARVLADAMGRAPDTGDRLRLVHRLLAVTAELEPRAAVPALNYAGEKVSDWQPLREVVRGLVVVARRTDADEAIHVYELAAGYLVEALGDLKNLDDHPEVASDLLALGEHMSAARAAHALIAAFAQTREEEILETLKLGLAVTLRRTRDPEMVLRGAVLSFGHLGAPNSLRSVLTGLHPQFHPRPQPLPPQDLVELLKHPFCVGEARRAVLNALEFTYRRSFKDQWEFVEYAQKHQPQLDLLTPPKRPEPKP